jgi:hypothetical protein
MDYQGLGGMELAQMTAHLDQLFLLCRLPFFYSFSVNYQNNYFQFHYLCSPHDQGQCSS